MRKCFITCIWEQGGCALLHCIAINYSCAIHASICFTLIGAYARIFKEIYLAKELIQIRLGHWILFGVTWTFQGGFPCRYAKGLSNFPPVMFSLFLCCFVFSFSLCTTPYFNSHCYFCLNDY